MQDDEVGDEVEEENGENRDPLWNLLPHVKYPPHVSPLLLPSIFIPFIGRNSYQKYVLGFIAVPAYHRSPQAPSSTACSLTQSPVSRSRLFFEIPACDNERWDNGLRIDFVNSSKAHIAEAENPRVVLPEAYLDESIFYQLSALFMLGTLAAGIKIHFNEITYVPSIQCPPDF